MRIFTDFLKTFQFAFDVRVVLLHLVEEARRLLARERGRLRGDRIQQNLALDLRIVVVGEFEHGVGEAEAVEILEPPEALQPRDVAVGDEVHRAVLGVLGEVVVVLDDHQHVAALDLLLGIEHVAADALVVAVGPLVRARDDDRLVAAVPGIAVLELFEELTALDRFDVGEIHFETGNLIKSVFEHAAHQRGVEEDARLRLLPHHLVHRAVDDVTVGVHRRRVERRAEIGPDGRQLRAVADQHQAASAAAADVLHEVRKQRSAAENGSALRVVRKHRGLVDDEHRSALGVDVEREFRFVIGVRALTVNAFVDGKCLFLSVLGQHFGGTPRGGQQHGFDSQVFKRTDKPGDKRRFSGSGIAVQHENPRKIVVCEIFGQLFYNFFLSGSCFETNFSVNLGRDTCAEHASVFN